MLVGSFQLLVAGGWELINAYSELNDPIAQKEAFKEQEKFFKGGLEDAQRMDEDYIEALEYGMPPTVGFGMGMDRLAMMKYKIDDVRLFRSGDLKFLQQF